MSAICGIFNMKGKPVLTLEAQSMMDAFRVAAVRQSEQWLSGAVFLGCHLQCFTPESVLEQLPAYDGRFGITADVIIDNRDELLQQFRLSEDCWSTITDSQLVLMAYKHWGHACVSHLIGDFAFVIWDSEKEALFCARDHVGKRTFYYRRTSEQFAFASLMLPLCNEKGTSAEWNDKWIADFLTLPNVAHEFECTETVYTNVLQLPPAHAMVVGKEGTTQWKYWDPLKLPKIRFNTDEEYEAAFRQVFFEAVRCRTRSLGEVGVMLSGGIDSGSVACVAAGVLDKQERKLKAYCAVPMEAYENWLAPRYLADESEYMESIGKVNQNVELNYCRFEGKDSLRDVDRLIGILEQPYKVVENLFWLDEIASTAVSQGCCVLLDGQFGNSTISYGSFPVNAYTLFRQLRFRTLRCEIRRYAERKGTKTSRVVRKLTKSFLPYQVQAVWHRLHARGIKKETSSPVNPKLTDKYKVKKRLRKSGFDEYPFRAYDFNGIREFLIHPSAFTHLGALETKLSLAYGIAKRDPTRDKRVIEFCMNLPSEQYVKDGMERSLVRRAMKGLLPDMVRLNTKTKGRQSADWVQRLEPRWSEIKEQLDGMIGNEKISAYIDLPQIKADLAQLNGAPPKSKQALLARKLVIALIFERFMRNTGQDSERR